ncbi:hypothetical protein [Petroclostridium sp. X23]|uniref:hypothetical protein n=1 Tax=Petroclostridium sp. X23 TaxID=3045146 RepID=UPI0024AE13D5|nr:hypothetical protein [Petroclostridium sp. X23]WHH59703.1 hypothetical protein QKW49_02780 [Petroclostridium sp. X23]
MSKTITLEKQARNEILKQMAGLNEITTDAVVDLIEPYFQFDVTNAREQALRRKANSLMAQFKDECGQRTCFSYKDNGQSKYVNIDETTDSEILNRLDDQLYKKLDTMLIIRKKIAKRLDELLKQTNIENSKV